MDLGSDIPITLIVKAPNQRIADQPVDCMLGWTIRKLKEHLENVYPSKPKHNQQKLIYSGKLLADHLTLKEVLRQFDENIQHTVHLVCGPSHSYETPGPSRSFESVPVSQTTPQPPVAESEGLRFRGHSTPETQNINHGAYPPMGMPPTPGYPYSPEQYMWMQQMYAQYMAQYMQYYHNTALMTPPSMPVTSEPEVVPANEEQPDNAAPANQNIRMNAQGGPVDDDEDEFNRDWLDYIYMFFRFLVLMSIVYFYSSFSRFLAVLGGFVFIYLLQNHWQNMQRQRHQRQREQQQAEQAPVQNPPPQQGQADQNEAPSENETGAENEAETENEANTAEQSESEGQPVPAEEEPKPGFFSVFWCFISTFFTSLIPQQPQAVNLN